MVDICISRRIVPYYNSIYTHLLFQVDHSIRRLTPSLAFFAFLPTACVVFITHPKGFVGGSAICGVRVLGSVLV